MTADEKLEAQREKAKIQELYRDDVLEYMPIIIKASSSGALETLLNEAEKIIGN
jgi:hypothetical protein